MTALAKAVALIKRFEGCKLTAYPDPASGGDPWTIGWGATGEGIHKGVVWTQEQADNRLLVDAQRFMRGVQKLCRATPTEGELAALTSFAYNVGLSNLGKSTLLRLYNEGREHEAAAQFPRWNKAQGAVMKGLTKRREAERAVFEGAA